MSDTYRRAVEAGIVFPRPGRGLIRITGPQRVWFLQNTVTADVEACEPGRWVESCLLSAKGKIVAHFRVGVADEELWLDVEEPGTSDLLSWFTANRFRTKVEIEERPDSPDSPDSPDRADSSVTTGRTVRTVLGPRAADIAGDGVVRADGRSVVFGGRLGDVAVADVHGSWPSGVPEPESAPDEEVYEILRIEAGVGRFGIDYDSGNLAQEAGLSHTLSVEKGCYVGQEVVARIHFRGHVNKVVRPLTFGSDGPPDVGASLLDDTAIGRVTSTAVSPRRGAIGLGMVSVRVDEGQTVEVQGGGSAVVGPVPPGTKISAGPPERRGVAP